MADAPDTLVLIDAYAHIYRCFHAIRGLTNARGEPSNALFGMARYLLQVDQMLPAEFGAVVWDKDRPAKRMEILPSYKGTRAPMPDEMVAQLPRIRDWVSAGGWPALEEQDWEADDVIAGIVGCRPPSTYTVILSPDKDLAQLVSDQVSLVSLKGQGQMTRLDPEGVCEKFGVPPALIPELLAMVGDSSDNIPGIPGVGLKTAASLLQQFGSFEAILADLDSVSRPALREALAGAADVVHRNRAVVTLEPTAPPAWSGLEGLRRSEPSWDRLISMAKAESFSSLLPALEKARLASRSPTLF